MRIRTIKTGDILIVYPSKNRVKVMFTTAEKVNLKESDERYCLKDYWKKKHGIILPKTFRIVTCQFATNYKEYGYPLYKKCVRKPFRQHEHKKMWKINRKYFHFNKLNKRGNGDNKGNWHPSSDYTMYQLGF